jgi:hypothetical protein
MNRILRTGLRSWATPKSLLDNGASHSFKSPVAYGQRATFTVRHTRPEADRGTGAPAKRR